MICVIFATYKVWSSTGNLTMWLQWLCIGHYYLSNMRLLSSDNLTFCGILALFLVLRLSALMALWGPQQNAILTKLYYCLDSGVYTASYRTLSCLNNIVYRTSWPIISVRWWCKFKLSWLKKIFYFVEGSGKKDKKLLKWLWTTGGDTFIDHV